MARYIKQDGEWIFGMHLHLTHTPTLETTMKRIQTTVLVGTNLVIYTVDCERAVLDAVRISKRTAHKVKFRPPPRKYTYLPTTGPRNSRRVS